MEGVESGDEARGELTSVSSEGRWPGVFCCVSVVGIKDMGRRINGSADFGQRMLDA